MVASLHFHQTGKSHVAIHTLASFNGTVGNSGYMNSCPLDSCGAARAKEAYSLPLQTLAPAVPPAI